LILFLISLSVKELVEEEKWRVTTQPIVLGE